VPGTYEKKIARTKGTILEGTFTPAPEARTIVRTPVCAGGAQPVVARFSVFAGVVRAIAGNGVIAIERLVLEQILLPRTSQNDQSERLVGLVHAVDRLGDF
jgi:hypothetical protein